MSVDADAYLQRIGLDARPPATLDGLAELTLAHLYTVPFENLDIPAGRPIELELPLIFDKVVARRRGGFCYELNGLYGWLLHELGFDRTILAARSTNKDELGIPFDHLLLRVDLDEPVLVDVGWGETYRAPLPLREGTEGDYRLEQRGDGAWDLFERGSPQYRFDLVPRELAEFGEACRWQQTESPYFTGHRTCTLATPEGRRTLYDSRLIVTSNGSRSIRDVPDEERAAVLRDLFGLLEPA